MTLWEIGFVVLALGISKGIKTKDSVEIFVSSSMLLAGLLIHWLF